MELMDRGEVMTSMDPAFQDETQSVTSPKTTMLQNLPVELQELVLLETIIAELGDRKIFRHAWKSSAERVVDRLRNVCRQWDNLLTTTSFRSRMDRIIDSFPKVKFCLNVHARGCFSNCVTVAAKNDDVYVLRRQPLQQSSIEIYSHNDLQKMKTSVRLPAGVTSPWDLVACSVENCLYVLHQTSHDIAIVRVFEEVQGFQVEHFVTCANQLVGRLIVSGDGSLILFQGPLPSKITVFNADSSMQYEIQLVVPISGLNSIIRKSNGSFIFVRNSYISECDGEGKKWCQYGKSDGQDQFGAIDKFDRMVIVDAIGCVRLLDTESNCVTSSKFKLQQLSECYHGHKEFYRISYNRERNEFVAIETAAYSDGGANQCLSVFDISERDISNETD